MTYLIQAMWINMLSHNDIKTYSFFNDIFNTGYMDKYVKP